MKPVVLTFNSWTKIRDHLMITQLPSVMLTRWKMREVLGFTDRQHTLSPDLWSGILEPQIEVHLDFFDEAKLTWFLLKYGEHIENRHSK